MSSRETVINLVTRLPEDMPLAEIAREIELLAGIKTAREQARRREGIPAEDARKLVKHESATRRVRRSSPATPRKRQARRSMRSLMAWYDSIRGTTDWEPPRMPDDLVRRVSL